MFISVDTLMYSLMLLHTRAVRCSLATAGGHSSAIVGGAGRGEDGVVRRLAAFGKQRCSGRLAPRCFLPGLVFVASQDEGVTGLAWRNMLYNREVGT